MNNAVEAAITAANDLFLAKGVARLLEIWQLVINADGTTTKYLSYVHLVFCF
jgi:hypothetical protein